MYSERMTKGAPIKYTYTVKFTKSAFMPWQYNVYQNGELLTDYPLLGYTSSAQTAWGARHAAKRYIRRYARHHGKVFNYER